MPLLHNENRKDECSFKNVLGLYSLQPAATQEFLNALKFVVGASVGVSLFSKKNINLLAVMPFVRDNLETALQNQILQEFFLSVVSFVLVPVTQLLREDQLLLERLKKRGKRVILLRMFKEEDENSKNIFGDSFWPDNTIDRLTFMEKLIGQTDTSKIWSIDDLKNVYSDIVRDYDNNNHLSPMAIIDRIKTKDWKSCIFYTHHFIEMFPPCKHMINTDDTHVKIWLELPRAIFNMLDLKTFLVIFGSTMENQFHVFVSIEGLQLEEEKEFTLKYEDGVLEIVLRKLLL